MTRQTRYVKCKATTPFSFTLSRLFIDETDQINETDEMNQDNEEIHDSRPDPFTMTDQIQIDTRNWKFNREEIYER